MLHPQHALNGKQDTAADFHGPIEQERNLQTLDSFVSHASSGQRRVARISPAGLLWFAALFAAGACTANADTISSNLTDLSAGTETAAGSTWLTASFGTGSSSAALDTVTLLLANSATGVAEVDLYTDGLLGPGSLLAQLSSSTTYSSALTDVSFTGTGVTLAANSTYWIVLKATTGAFDWSWTADNTGTGVGYQGTWGTSTDAGTTWFTYAVFPTQFSVTTADSVTAAAPEPGSWFLSAGSLVIGIGMYRNKKKKCGKTEAGRL